MFKIMNDRFYSNARAFVATARAGSMTAAARELNATKSGISQKVSLLEADLDLKLLRRRGRTVVPTAAGERMFELLVPMVDAALEAEALLFEGGGKTLSGRVAVSGPNSFMTTVVMPIVAEFSSEHPDVRIELKASDWSVDFAAADIDLGFRIGPVPKGRFIKKKLAVTQRMLCASPSFVKRNAGVRRPSDLRAVQCILRQQEPSTWRLLSPNKRLETVKPARAIFVDSMEMAQSAAIEGAGVALLPKILAAPDIEAGKLVAMMPGWFSEPVDVTLLCRPSSLPKPQVAALRRVLISRCVDSAFPKKGGPQARSHK